MIEFVSCFGVGNIDFLNYWERSLGGSIVSIAYESMVAFHQVLVGYWLEDIIFGDLNQSYGQKGLRHLIWDNWGWYVGNIISIPTYFAIQWYFTGELFRDRLFPAFTSLFDIKSMMLPIEWKPVNLMTLRNYSEQYGAGVNQAE